MMTKMRKWMMMSEELARRMMRKVTQVMILKKKSCKALTKIYGAYICNSKKALS